MREFFRPGFWDILGTLLGIAGLVGSGTIALRFSPSAYVLIGTLASILAVAYGGFSLQRYLSARAFPLADVEHNVRLTFTTDSAQRVRAVLNRSSSFAPRAANLYSFDRYQSVPHQPGLTAARTLEVAQHRFDVTAQRGGWLDHTWTELNSVRVEPTYSGFRQLRLEYKFVNHMKESGRRIKISEQLDLPNDFSQPLEFYEVEISEPSRARTFEFVFSDIRVADARVYILHGAKRGPPRRLPVEALPGQANGCRFALKLREAPIGAKLRFEWDWRGI